MFQRFTMRASALDLVGQALHTVAHRRLADVSICQPELAFDLVGSPAPRGGEHGSRASSATKALITYVKH